MITSVIVLLAEKIETVSQMALLFY